MRACGCGNLGGCPNNVHVPSQHACFLLNYWFYKVQNVFFVFIFALPSLLFWVLIYPLFNLSKLFKSKNFLNTIDIRKKFGFLYNSYRINYYYFDCVEIYKKYLLILIINFLQISVETKSLIILLILGASSYFLATKSPYLTQDVTNLAFLSDVVSLSTLFFGLLSFSAEDQFFSVLGNIIAIFLNVVFFGTFTFKMMTIYKHKILKIVSNTPALKNLMQKFFDNFAKIPTNSDRRLTKSKVLNTKKLIIDSNREC